MIMGRVISGFPYPAKTCPYCNAILVVVNAIHWRGDEHQYKALYLDPNAECPVYDEGAMKAYARVYYSSEDSFAYFRDVKIPVKRWSKQDLYTIYQ